MAASFPERLAVVFPLSLDEICIGDMVDLTKAQQRRQWSKPFLKFGLIWLLTLERYRKNNDEAAFEISVVLYCLSVTQTPETFETFPLKGEIRIDHLGLPAGCFFHAEEGRCCNLVGTHFPADALHMKKGVVLSLESGAIQSNEIEVSLMDSSGEVGGFYGPDRRGVLGVVLEDYKPDPCRDGRNIKVTVEFPEKPRALRYVDDDQED